MSRPRSLLLATLAVLGLVALPTPASAAGESLACQITPGPGTATTGACYTWSYAGTYYVDLFVQGGSGPATYSWSPAGTPLSGCSPSYNTCTFRVYGQSADQSLMSSVTVTGGGQTTTLSVVAQIPGV